MRRFTGIIVCLIVFWLAQGCTHSYYAPNQINLTHLEQKNDGSLNGSFLWGFIKYGYDIQAAYSPLRHVGIMANGFQIFRYPRTRTIGGQDKISLFEGAVGLYQPTKAGTVSLFAGYGGGSAKSTYVMPGYAPDMQSDLTIRRFFIQPAITIKDDIVEVGAACRISRVDFPRGNVDGRLQYISSSFAESGGIQEIDSNRSAWLTDVGCRIMARVKPCTLGFVATLMLTTKKPANYFDHMTVGLSCGINLQDLKKTGK
jgi:hypothetical protein